MPKLPRHKHGLVGWSVKPWGGAQGCSYRVTCHSEDRSRPWLSSHPTSVPSPPLEGLLLGTIPQGTRVPLHPLALPSGAAEIATITFPRTRGTPSHRLSASSPTYYCPCAKYVTLNRQDVTAVSKARLQRSPRPKLGTHNRNLCLSMFVVGFGRGAKTCRVSL